MSLLFFCLPTAITGCATQKGSWGQEVLLPTKDELQRGWCLEEVRCQLSLHPASASDVIWYELGVAQSLISCKAEL